MTTTLSADQQRGLHDLLVRTQAMVSQALHLLDGDQDPTLPQISDEDRDRLMKVGESAWRHREFLRREGRLTVGDSRVIRRQLNVPMRSTANHFGRSDGNEILYRDVPYGTATRDDQDVRLTAEGERMAELWEQLHEGR